MGSSERSRHGTRRLPERRSVALETAKSDNAVSWFASAKQSGEQQTLSPPGEDHAASQTSVANPHGTGQRDRAQRTPAKFDQLRSVLVELDDRRGNVAERRSRPQCVSMSVDSHMWYQLRPANWGSDHHHLKGRSGADRSSSRS